MAEQVPRSKGPKRARPQPRRQAGVRAIAQLAHQEETYSPEIAGRPGVLPWDQYWDELTDPRPLGWI